MVTITRLKASLFLIPLMLVAMLTATAQTQKFKNGAYRNSVDFLNRKPLYTSEFIFKQKSYHPYVDELCRVKARNPRVGKAKLNMNVWGIYVDGAFYLNARRIGLADGFIKIGKLEKYSCFRAPYKLTQDQKIRQQFSAFAFGAAGSAVSEYRIDKENKDKVHYILNYRTGMVNLLTKQYLERILEDNPEISYRFLKEQNQESFDVLFKYIELINGED